MKFSITNAFLSALTLGAVSGGINNLEDEEFWTAFAAQNFDSMAISDAPSDGPSLISDAPSDGPSLISDAPSDGPSLNAFSNVPTILPTSTDPSTDGCKSIVETLCSQSEFFVLCLLVNVTDLVDALEEEVFTIFAPTNDAFDAFDAIPTVGNDMEEGLDIVRNVILYHAVPGVKLLAEDLVCDGSLMMVNSEESTTVCIGDEIFQVGNANTFDALPRITAPDVIACNGIIHAIDQVMIPSVELPEDTCETIADVICTLPEFEILCIALTRFDFLDIFGGEDQFTIFAPTNDAFEAFPQDLEDFFLSDDFALTELLGSHAVSGVIFSTDLECGGELLMISERETTTVCLNDEVFQGGSGNNLDTLPKIVGPDGIACNGVIHAINNVILPAL